MFPTTVRLMRFLRERNQAVRRNNLRIDSWVDAYIDSCVATGTNITFLTQWCLTKGLERRFAGVDQFTATAKEVALWQEHIPAIIHQFQKLGLGLDWYFTFNRGFTSSRRLGLEIEIKYKKLVQNLAESSQVSVVFFDWETDILGSATKPDQRVLDDPAQFVRQKALDQELHWARMWMEHETNLMQSEEEIRRDVLLQIACEAQEGQFLASSDNPLGSEFVLVPLEVPEQYDFFSVFIPDFKKRIAAVLPPYPWRLKPTEED